MKLWYVQLDLVLYDDPPTPPRNCTMRRATQKHIERFSKRKEKDPYLCRVEETIDGYALLQGFGERCGDMIHDTRDMQEERRPTVSETELRSVLAYSWMHSMGDRMGFAWIYGS